MNGDRVRRELGFTLLELMIVVGIIAILAAILLPNLMRSRLQTNESGAVEGLRVVCSAQFTFHGAKNTFGDFATLTSTEGEGAPFLSGSWGADVDKAGYKFEMAEVSTANFVCYADPTDPGKTGVRYFMVDASGIIHWSKSERPTTDDPVLGTTSDEEDA